MGSVPDAQMIHDGIWLYGTGGNESRQAALVRRVALWCKSTCAPHEKLRRLRGSNRPRLWPLGKSDLKREGEL